MPLHSPKHPKLFVERKDFDYITNTERETLTRQDKHRQEPEKVPIALHSSKAGVSVSGDIVGDGEDVFESALSRIEMHRAVLDLSEVTRITSTSAQTLANYVFAWRAKKRKITVIVSPSVRTILHSLGLLSRMRVE